MDLFKFIANSDYRLDVLASHGLLNWLSDKVYIKIRYKHFFGREISIDKPITYNEKLQWIKLYEHNPIYTQMVDKYEAKKFVAEKIGDEYIIPTLGVWDRFDEIDFDELPNQFVLKCTHDSGGLIIVKDKKLLDYDAARAKINKSLKNNFFYYGREWPYKNVKPRIIAELYMSEDLSINNTEPDNIARTSSNGILNDYKIYTFNGKAKICMINTDRGMRTRADYFDKDFNWLDFKWGYDHALVRPNKPKQYEEMFRLAEILANGTTELRVDFYVVNDKIYFGELTFFDGSGFDAIIPEEWDYKLGEMLNLPQKRRTK